MKHRRLRNETAFWLLIILIVSSIMSLTYVTAARASESTLVMSDNTVIKTIHKYDGNLSQNTSILVSDNELYPVIQESSYNHVQPTISNPIAQHDCFDRIKLLRNKASRYQAIDQCIQGVAA